MTPEDWRKVREILEQALELAPGDRAAYLEKACVGDRALRSEVDSLIASNAQASTDFLQLGALDSIADSGLLSETASLAGQRIGPYQIVEEVGHGGMGRGYRAARPCCRSRYRSQHLRY